LTFSRYASARLYKRESNPKIKERLLLVLKVEGDGMLPAHAADELHRSRPWALLAHMSNLREPLGILFKQYATDHSVILYGDPSPELIQTAKTIGVEVRTYSFLQGLD
jgi:hypothetical protein